MKREKLSSIEDRGQTDHFTALPHYLLCPCLYYKTVSAETLSLQAVRPPRSSFVCLFVQTDIVTRECNFLMPTVVGGQCPIPA